jgi:hypothetical protein
MQHGSSGHDNESVLIAHGRDFQRKPLLEWQAAVRRATDKMRERLDFMTAGHHAVRTFVVRELPQFQRPISIMEIAASVGLTVSRVQSIVEELERKLFFLVRNRAGEVAWAFPLTADRTPHEMKLSTGQRTFGACAEDAFAAPFVLGRLSRRRLQVDIRSICGQSGRPLRLTVASDLRWSAHASNVQHLLFVPSVDWQTFGAPNIINAY